MTPAGSETGMSDTNPIQEFPLFNAIAAREAAERGIGQAAENKG